MVRWTYLVPRLLLLGALVAAVRFGTAPLVRLAIVRSGQAATGAEVNLDTVRVRFLDTAVDLGRLQIADPRAPERNAVEISGATLELDSRALRHKRLVIRQGVLRDLRLQAPRETSGVLPNRDSSSDKADEDGDVPAWQQAAKDWARNWREDFEERVRADFENDFQSVRLARDLRERWPNEYAQLKTRVSTWKSRAERLRDVARSPTNHLRTVDDYRTLLGDLQRAKLEIPELRNEYRRLRNQLTQDRRAIDAAQIHDRQVLKERLALRDFDGGQMGEYLLGPVVHQQWERAAGWLHRGKQLLTLIAGKPKVNHVQSGRGTTYFFGRQDEPSLWFQQLALDGQWEQGEFSGQLTNLTTEPQLCPHPLCLRLKATGELPAQVVAMVDLRNEHPVERVQVQISPFVFPDQQLGDPGRLAWKIEGGQGVVWLDATLEQGQVQGRLIIHQKEVVLAPEVGETWGGEGARQRLAAAVERIDSVQVVADLAGSLSRPQVRIQSNLGPHLAAVSDQLVRDELDRRRQQLELAAQNRVSEHLQPLEALVQSQEEEFDRLAEAWEQQLADVQQKLTGRLPLPVGWTATRR